MIEVSDLHKRYGKTTALAGATFTVDDGRIVGLIGRNGAGKTTLLRIMIGLAFASRGSARVLGYALSEDDPATIAAKARVAYVGQGEFLPQWASIEDLARFEQSLRPEWDGSHLVRWAESERLPLDKTLRTFSVGQRKRCELELALAARPRVLLMDEPFAGLDPVSRTEFLEHFMTLAAETGMSALVSSHALGDIERICDSVLMLARGFASIFRVNADSSGSGTA